MKNWITYKKYEKMKNFRFWSFQKNDLGNGIDLLVLDVQGHEFKILENLPNIKKLPFFIVYEDDSSMSDMDSKNLSYLLIKYGYRLILPGANKVWTNIFYN